MTLLGRTCPPSVFESPTLGHQLLHCHFALPFQLSLRQGLGTEAVSEGRLGSGDSVYSVEGQRGPQKEPMARLEPGSTEAL